MLDIMLDTRKNKRYGRDSIDFEVDWAPLLVRMFKELKARDFRIRHNYTFLTSIPKWREIFATEFVGRIADHMLCDTLSPYMERELHPRTFNNRIGMGSQAAINQVIEDICEVSKCYTETAWIIKWDLKGFFPNADCIYMEQCFDRIIDKYADEIAEQFEDEEMPAFLKWLAMVTIHCYPALHYERRTPPQLWDLHIDPSKSILNKPYGIGVPIGRMSSQNGMGLYINDEVAWLNDDCGICTTVFMDDGTMITADEMKDYALSLLPELRKRLAAKGVRMNDKKFYCQQYWKGLEFLGSHIHTDRLILNDATWFRCKERIEEYNHDPFKYQHLDKFMATVNSYTGLLKNRTSYRRIQELRELIHPVWWQWLDWDERRLCVVGKPEHTLRERLRRKYHLKIKRI